MLDADGTPNKSKLGANAILAVSMATARAAAPTRCRPAPVALPRRRQARVLPVPMMNILNGGAHADNGLDVQEFMIMPGGLRHASPTRCAGVEVFHALKGPQEGRPRDRRRRRGRLRPAPQEQRGGHGARGRRGRGAGYKPGEEIALALDVAASELFDSEGPSATAGQAAEDPDEIVEMVRIVWCERFPARSPSRTASPRTTGRAGSSSPRRLGPTVQLVGDDLFVTNPKRLKRASSEGSPTRSSSSSTRSAP
jgi:enolase